MTAVSRIPRVDGHEIGELYVIAGGDRVAPFRNKKNRRRFDFSITDRYNNDLRFHALYIEEMKVQVNFLILVTVEEIMAFRIPGIRSRIIRAVEISGTGFVAAVYEGTWVFRYLGPGGYTIICCRRNE